MLLRLKRKLAAGFTTIEILAVAGMVSGGYAGYSDALMKAKNKAIEAKCMSNLKQIGQALQMYEMEHGKLPDAGFYPKDPLKNPESLRVILGEEFGQFLVCPSMPKELQKRGLTFIWNDKYSGKPLSAIKEPTKTWLLMEMSVVDEKVPPPHRGGFMMLYADFHVKWTKEIPPEVRPKKKSAEE